MLLETKFLLQESLSKLVSGNFALLEILKQWGIKHYAGVNGGGVIKIAQHLLPLTHLHQLRDGIPRMLTMNEYITGFIPLGYYLATGKFAGTILTTGAATKLGLCGLTEAKLHNIPAVYLVALNSTQVHDKAPLQDVSENGMNLIPQLQAELGDGCVVIDDLSVIEDKLLMVQKILSQSRPVVIAFHPDILSQDIDLNQLSFPPTHSNSEINYSDIDALASQLAQIQPTQRIILYVGEEAARYEQISSLIDDLSYRLKSPIIWSVNGANAVSETNPYGYGHIMFGGNDRAMKLWQSINSDDVLIMIGLDPYEYVLNNEQIRAGNVWHLTHFLCPYGHKDGNFQHRAAFEYQKVYGDIVLVLQELLNRLPQNKDLSGVNPPLVSLNTRIISRTVRPDTVDLLSFYEQIGQLWQPNTIGFDDVCMAYKDRPYLMQRRHPNIRFHSMYHGSAMGGAFGLGCGAKLGNPLLHTFIFSGDGCWRLYGGAIADASHLGLCLFIINNHSYGIIEQGAPSILPGVDSTRYHAHLQNIDFVAAAKAHAWDGYRLKPDLSNLLEIMDVCYNSNSQSILVEVPVDSTQVIGLNPRVLNLRGDCHL
ncbi:thiamine pyrophosphate-dependent enzyme, possible carboligase or decarboxylase [Cylindrospermum stagnale PCC 7417]|uniref:Thiamine pyrophosphate-dependent enzyme, possible carboligase or decarboxylase n=1 Tax=Cylindrospermum stagnale PCC 7417 TaxID=56107 RepID=K9WSQ6_9NOST|nr:thiamine pyrophosphate-dependent enzyme [Cylindrospermum stagnale]AFZ22834.1 thiamine pyrophosphate-dependent enzyme, possible carboligase or decarboxylase [Cylindrospermum stagnale PCC 7417]